MHFVTRRNFIVWWLMKRVAQSVLKTFVIKAIFKAKSYFFRTSRFFGMRGLIGFLFAVI